MSTSSLQAEASMPSAASTGCNSCARNGRCVGGLLVEGMSPEQVQAAGITRVVLDKGDHLFRVGDRAEHLYAVRGGALKTYVISADGGEEIRGFQLAEDVAGLDAVCQPTFRASVRALSRTWVCRLPLVAVRARMVDSVSFRDRILAGLGREFDRLNGMLHRERRTADQRVASFLVTQLGAAPVQRNEIELPMSRVDLARFLDLATETVSRVFTRFQARNILRSQGARCQVIDREALFAMA